MKRICVLTLLCLVVLCATAANAQDRVLREYPTGEAIIDGNRLIPDPVLSVVLTADSMLCFRASDGTLYPFMSVKAPKPALQKPIVVREETRKLRSALDGIEQAGLTSLRHGRSEREVLDAMLTYARINPFVERAELGQGGTVHGWLKTGREFVVSIPDTTVLQSQPVQPVTPLQNILKMLDTSLGQGGMCIKGIDIKGYEYLSWVPACQRRAVLEEIGCAKEILRGTYRATVLPESVQSAFFRDIENPKPAARKGVEQ